MRLQALRSKKLMTISNNRWSMALKTLSAAILQMSWIRGIFWCRVFSRLTVIWLSCIDSGMKSYLQQQKLLFYSRYTWHNARLLAKRRQGSRLVMGSRLILLTLMTKKWNLSILLMMAVLTWWKSTLRLRNLTRFLCQISTSAAQTASN